MKIPERFTSRKFLGLILATGLVAFDRLSDWCWIVAYVIYLSGNELDQAIELAKLWLTRGKTNDQ